MHAQLQLGVLQRHTGKPAALGYVAALPCSLLSKARVHSWICRYVSGRVRAPGEINGKSGNLNHCLQNVVYAGMLPPAEGSCGIHIEHKGRTVSTEEALCISAAAPPAPAGAAAPAVPGIPAQEMVVVFDADMCAKPNFFRHVSVLVFGWV